MKLTQASAMGATLALLLGCAAPARPAFQMPERLVPVAVQCRPDIGPEPNYPDTDAALRAAPDIFVRVRLLLAGRLMRTARARELQAALARCQA